MGLLTVLILSDKFGLIGFHGYLLTTAFDIIDDPFLLSTWEKFCSCTLSSCTHLGGKQLVKSADIHHQYGFTHGGPCWRRL